MSKDHTIFSVTISKRKGPRLRAVGREEDRSMHSIIRRLVYLIPSGN